MAISWFQVVLVIAGVVFLWRLIQNTFFLKNVKGQIVLITGGASGIGLLMAKNFLKLGSTVVIWDVSDQSLQKALQELKTIGTAHGYQCDITDAQAVYRTAELVKKEVGTVNILINNAGVVNGKRLQELDDAQITRTFMVNSVSHLFTAKAFLPGMIDANKGHIVTIASLAGIIGQPRLTDYCASKSAAIGFHEALHQELRLHKVKGVHTTCICPYFINTGMFAGAKSKYPLLMPLLDQNYVADKIVHSIRRNRALVIMPRFFYLVPILRPFLPRWLEDAIGDRLGSLEAMMDFTGRQQPTTAASAATKQD